MRCQACVDKGLSTCVPQWRAKKLSTACVYCARQKKSCPSSEAWCAVVEKLFPFRGRPSKSSQHYSNLLISPKSHIDLVAQHAAQASQQASQQAGPSRGEW